MSGNPEATASWGEGAEPLDPSTLSDSKLAKMINGLPKNSRQRREFVEERDIRTSSQVGVPD